MKILVVDDAEENRELLACYLKDHFNNLSFAADGYEALQKCTHENFDFILMDIQMPRMDGYEAAQKIRLLQKDSHSAAIFATTANSRPSDIERSLQSGFNAHLPKPIQRDFLLEFMKLWSQGKDLVAEKSPKGSSTASSIQAKSLK